MTSYIIDSAIPAIWAYMESVGGDIGYDPFHQWLFDNLPHVRVQTIGDEPSVWFSVSRCNPPSEDMENQTKEIVRFLNELVALCFLGYGQYEAHEFFMSI